MSDKEEIQAIETGLKAHEAAFSSRNVAVLSNNYKKLVKNFLVSEMYFKKATAENSPEFVMKIMNRYYEKMTIYPPKFTDEFGENIYFAIEYNNKAITAANQLKKYTTVIFNSPQLVTTPKDSSNLVQISKVIGKHELYDESLAGRKKFHAEMEYYAGLIYEFTESILNVSELQASPGVVIDELKEGILSEISTFEKIRKSPTRGMEAGSPLPYVKGTIAVIAYGINVVDNFISWLRRSDWEAMHVQGTPKPPESHLDESFRAMLNNLGNIFAVLTALGCLPMNYQKRRI